MIFEETFEINNKQISYIRYGECPQLKNTFPVFIWNGTDDNTTPISFAKHLSRQYNTAKLHIVENMGHMLYLPCWEKILKEIMDIR